MYTLPDKVMRTSNDFELFCTVNLFIIWTPKILTVRRMYYRKYFKNRFYNAGMCLEDADGKPNSVGPEQTAPMISLI